MSWKRNDLLVIVGVVVLLVVLAAGSLRRKGKPIPKDFQHATIYQDLKNGRPSREIELACTTCHSKSSVPLPDRHPPKEQCLTCHPVRK